MIRSVLILFSVLCLMASASRADPQTWKQLAEIHRKAAESGEKVKMKRHREVAERLVTTAAGEPVAVTSFADGSVQTNRINTVVRTARLGSPAALPEPAPGKHSKEYLSGFADGVSATQAAFKKGKK